MEVEGLSREIPTGVGPSKEIPTGHEPPKEPEINHEAEAHKKTIEELKRQMQVLQSEHADKVTQL